MKSKRGIKSKKKHEKNISSTNESDLGDKQQGRVLAHFGKSYSIEADNGDIYHCLGRRNLTRIVCGDLVIWQSTGNDTGVISELLPRESLLSRPNANGLLKPVAANIHQILVVAAPIPTIDEDLLDRYLIAARLINIDAVIVINKIDLLDDKQYQQLKERLDIYQKLNYKVLYTTIMRDNGLEPLLQQLNNKTSIFVGQSGVGKSSIIQNLLPDADIRIGELSTATGLGKHTTSVSVLYRIAGGYLIDSPGVREFGLGHVSIDQIAAGFIDFDEFVDGCKFNNCSHRHEPHCAVIDAVKQGLIASRRYDRYKQIMDSYDHRHPSKQ